MEPETLLYWQKLLTSAIVPMAAGVSSDEAATLEREAVRDAQVVLAETARRAQAMPAAAAAVKEVLARRQADQATTSNDRA